MSHDALSGGQFEEHVRPAGGWDRGREYEPEEITHYNTGQHMAPTDADPSWLRKSYGENTKFVYDELPRHKVSFGGGERLVDNDPEAEDRYVHSMVSAGVHRLPPVLVGPDQGKGVHAVWDGSHRMEAHDRAGSKTIPVMKPVHHEP